MCYLFKATAALPLLLAYFLTSAVLAILPVSTRQRRSFLVRNTSFFSRLALSLLGIRVHAKHRERLQTGGTARLIVSNHVSYLDVLVISSLVPSAFITSVELGSTVYLGLLARLGGSLFVERRKATGLKREIAAITRTLRDGMTVTFFPEGTTSNGDTVHAFKNALFDAARTAATNIVPICIRYTAVNGEPLSERNRDLIYYYGGAVFFRHLTRLLSLRSTNVEVIPLRTIHPDAGTTRKELAAIAHQEILEAFHESSPRKTGRARTLPRASA